jgi:LL-diaminopimelate aminotransferase
MTGWRIGFVVGNREVLAGLGRVKTNVDSGVFQAVQEAAIAALTGPQDYVAGARAVYQERRDVVVAGLRKLGLPVLAPRATFFVWAPVPNGGDSREWASRLLQEAGVVVTPGVGFGPSGEGYYRIALTVDKARIAEAVERLAKLSL